MTYIITFICYGNRLHGHESGTVDRKHNLPGSRLVPPDPKRLQAEKRQMDQPPYLLDAGRRELVLTAILERCLQNNWTLLAAHVRTNHVHVVVEAEASPERVMNDLKSFASRLLNQKAFDTPDRKRWARHGSTRWLWNEESISAAIRYVVYEQGTRMSVWPDFSEP